MCLAGAAYGLPQYAPGPAPYVPAPYAPAPYAPAPPKAYAPAPYVEEKEPPKPFAYEYGGQDDYGRKFAKTETQDAYGVVNGKGMAKYYTKKKMRNLSDIIPLIFAIIADDWEN